MTGISVEAEDADTEVFGTVVEDIQEDIVVENGRITGTLKYLDSGDIVDAWGEGNFLVLKFDDIDENATSVKVGMEPSQGSGLVEIIDDPDKNGVFKVTDKNAQKFKYVVTSATDVITQTFDLSGLTCEEE